MMTRERIARTDHSYEREDAEHALAEDRADQRRSEPVEKPDRHGRDADWHYVREHGKRLTRGGWS